MKKVKFVLIFLVAVIFVLVPLPAADINIRLVFEGGAEGNYALYYATTAGFSQEQCITATVESDTNQVTFTLEGSLENQLTGLRFDFPSGENVICIKNITVSSAGIVQKQFEPCAFFAGENISNQNHIPEIVRVESRDRAYIVTAGDDPYIITTSTVCDAIRDGFSHLRLTRFGICIFLTACYLMYKKNLFSSK